MASVKALLGGGLAALCEHIKGIRTTVGDLAEATAQSVDEIDGILHEKQDINSKVWRLSKPSSRGRLQKRSLPCKSSAELLYCPWNYFGITATVEDTDYTDAAEIWRLHGRKSTTKDVEQPFGERMGVIPKTPEARMNTGFFARQNGSRYWIDTNFSNPVLQEEHFKMPNKATLLN